MDDQGAVDAFTGGYSIVAGKDGLRSRTCITAAGTQCRVTSWKILPHGYTSRTNGSMPGDFSIPTDKAKYRKYSTFPARSARS
jgi:hypothetical protein